MKKLLDTAALLIYCAYVDATLAKRGLECTRTVMLNEHSLSFVRRVLLSPFTYEKMEAELGQVVGPAGRKKVESGFKSRQDSQVLTPAGNKASWQLRLSEELVLTRVLLPSSSSDHV